jgi:hypothetical protein
LETLDVADMEPRLVRLCHAIGHLKRLHKDLDERRLLWRRQPRPRWPAHTLWP